MYDLRKILVFDLQTTGAFGLHKILHYECLVENEEILEDSRLRMHLEAPLLSQGYQVAAVVLGACLKKTRIAEHLVALAHCQPRKAPYSRVLDPSAELGHYLHKRYQRRLPYVPWPVSFG